MRGEDNHKKLCRCDKGGSPPHARGRLKLEVTKDPITRITPACAGKTPFGVSRYGGMQDHPRMRGEDFARSTIASSRSGSPPHARGRQTMSFNLGTAWRITPACAGKTGRGTVREPSAPDHPRMRGEDERSNPDYLDTIGSPPHARGRPLFILETAVRQRITPACAGKTVGVGLGAALDRDHPRMRGEDPHSRRDYRHLRGSPPHARGRRRC